MSDATKTKTENQISTYFAALLQVVKNFVERLVKTVFDNGVHQLKEPGPIFVIHQAIVKDSEDLVNKQAYQSLLVF